jgi:class 3 adenylate cyclase/Tfp pilus assembly protein PilF
VKRKIAVILAADIAGYSRLIAEDEEETLRRFEGYRTVFSEFVDRGGGRIFNTAGDAILAEFQSAVEAVRCAVDVQESLKARNLAYPPSRHMNFRIGITIGDVVEREGGDLLGDGVNIAARLESVAPPGGICVSRSVHEAVASKMALRFSDAGPQSLKNIPERVHAYTLALEESHPGTVVMQNAGGGEAPPAAAQKSAVPAADRQSHLISAGLAVLAIALAGAYAYEYLPDSVRETIGLETRQPQPAPVAETPAPSAGPTVAATPQPEPAATPAPVAPEKTEPPPPPEPKRAEKPQETTPSEVEKQVEAALNAPSSGTTDSEQKRPNPLASRYVLTRQWNDCHESTNADVAADACKGLLESGGLNDDDQATVRYKLGRALRDKGEPDQAIESYDRSIALKPTADAYNHRGIAYFDKSDYAKAIDDYTAALKLSPSLAEAINNRAWTYYKTGDLNAALQDANRAVSLDGTKSYIWDTRGHIHEARGSKTAAISDYKKALTLDASAESSAEGLRRLGAN